MNGRCQDGCAIRTSLPTRKRTSLHGPTPDNRQPADYYRAVPLPHLRPPAARVLLLRPTSPVLSTVNRNSLANFSPGASTVIPCASPPPRQIHRINRMINRFKAEIILPRRRIKHVVIRIRRNRQREPALRPHHTGAPAPSSKRVVHQCRRHRIRHTELPGRRRRHMPHRQPVITAEPQAARRCRQLRIRLAHQKRMQPKPERQRIPARYSRHQA